LLTFSPGFAPSFLLYRWRFSKPHPCSPKRNDPKWLFVRAKPRLFGARKLPGAIKSAPARVWRHPWQRQREIMAINAHAQMPSPNQFHYRPEQEQLRLSCCGKQCKIRASTQRPTLPGRKGPCRHKRTAVRRAAMKANFGNGWRRVRTKIICRRCSSFAPLSWRAGRRRQLTALPPCNILGSMRAHGRFRWLLHA